MTLGIDGKDAVHIALAIEGKAELFFTTASDIIKRGKNICKTRIVNPVQYFTEQYYMENTI
jgi:predicted nucleic acid-binding protein